MGDDSYIDVDTITATATTPFSPHAIHLVRTAQQMNLQLSAMADQKASILMGATFVVFTISMGQVAKGGTVSLPLLVLALFSFLSAMLAVFAVLPSIGSPKTHANPNILFFGVFTSMSEQAFADEIVSRLHLDETVFRTMLRDIHQNGMVMQRKKYRFLGLAYRCFLVGLVATVTTFLVTQLG